MILATWWLLAGFVVTVSAAQKNVEQQLPLGGPDVAGGHGPLGFVAEASRHEGEKVLRLTTDDRDVARQLVAEGRRGTLDVWGANTTSVDIRVREEEIGDVLHFANKHGLHAEVLVDDLARMIVESAPPPEQGESDFFAHYHDYETVRSWMRFRADWFSDLVEYHVLGMTHEGREIPALQITAVNLSKQHEIGRFDHKAVMIVAGQHAREWIGVTTATYIASQLMSGYETNELVRDVLDQHVVYVIPILNPDGYAYTWEHDRLWRRNRQPTKDSTNECIGIDLDSNWPFQYDLNRVTNPCSESYAGTEPLEARENEHLHTFIRSMQRNYGLPFIGYVDLHSYSQAVLYPYAYDCDRIPADEENLLELAYGAAKALRATNSQLYDASSACENMGGFGWGGAMLDWMYERGGIPWSYMLKLRDRGVNGYLLPEKEILPTAKETFQMILYFCGFIEHPEH